MTDAKVLISFGFPIAQAFFMAREAKSGDKNLTHFIQSIRNGFSKIQ